MRFTEVARGHGDVPSPRVAPGSGADCGAISTAWLGRRVVSPRLLRRRFPAGVRAQPRVPDRFDRAELVRAIRCGGCNRARLAMEAVDQRLVRREQALIQLLAPPFDKSDLNPGYIKGYVPGVRENGGQYTHAALWVAMAFAALGDRRAWELLALINPVNHARSPEEIAIYKVEPYVVAADVLRSRPILAAVAGRGTRGLPAGCTG